MFLILTVNKYNFTDLCSLSQKSSLAKFALGSRSVDKLMTTSETTKSLFSLFF